MINDLVSAAFVRAGMLLLVLVFLRLILAAIVGAKLQGIVEEKLSSQSMWGISIFLIVFFGLLGVIIACLMAIAVSGRPTEVNQGNYSSYNEAYNEQYR